MTALIVTNELTSAIRVTTADELDAVLQSATEESHAREMLNVIFIEGKDGNTISMVVGDDETVLVFTYGHGNPPYYESRGSIVADDPVFTCYISFLHHTEFSRRCVIPVAQGQRAVHEFFETGALPSLVTWAET